MGFSLLARLIAPYTRREWPGTWRLLRWLNVTNPDTDPAWSGGSESIVRGKWHGYRMVLDPCDWMDRSAYFLARYYDVSTQLAMMQLVEPNDRVVDIGANHGMLTLLAAACVGPNGSVEAFEPHPGCVERIQRQIELNGIRHVRLHEAALSNKTTRATLHFAPRHAGYSTLTFPEGEAASTLTHAVEVNLIRGDDALLSDPAPVRLIKMDVEGHEPRAIEGLSQIIRRDRPAILCEINPCCLRSAGSSPEDITRVLVAHGYRGYVLSERRQRLITSPLDLDEQPTRTIDSLWLHPGSVAERRFHPVMPVTQVARRRKAA
ncbi:MAG: FkbM family methyltransferase [Phycisphaeraceae bacterium]